MSQNNVCVVCGDEKANDNICNQCIISFTLSRPCNACFYTQNLDGYTPDQWNNPYRVCKGCLKDGKTART